MDQDQIRELSENYAYISPLVQFIHQDIQELNQRIFQDLPKFRQDLREFQLRVKSLTSEATPSATQFFKRSYKISHSPELYASWDALPSFASSSQNAEIGLSK